MESAFRAHMNPEMFWEATLLEVMLMIRGYREREKEEWQRTRILAYMTYCANTKQDERKTVEQFMPLPGDEKSVEVSSEEELQRFYNETMAWYDVYTPKSSKLLN